MRRPRFRYVLLVWGAFALVQCAFSLFTMRSANDAPKELFFYASLALLWALCTPLIWWWAQWLDRRGWSLVATSAAHIAGVLALAIVDALVRRWLVTALGGVHRVPFQTTVLYFADLTAAAYFAVVIVGRALEGESALLVQSRRELALRAQLAEARLEYLEAQLQPHFLFNALGTVIELAHEAPASAARMLRQLAALLRFAVHGRGSRVTVAEELSSLEPYLDIQRIRFADWLVIDHDVADATLDIPIPRFTLQPLVENAVRHGLIGRTMRGEIRILARTEGDSLVLAVHDNGVGLRDLEGDLSYGVGLSNVRQRLESAYGSAFTLTLETAASGGTVAEIRVPRAMPGDAVADMTTDTTAAMAPREGLMDLMQRHAALATVLGWLIWGTLWMQQSIAFLTMQHRPYSLPKLVFDHLLAVGLWCVLTPLVFYVARRFPLTNGGRRWNPAAHVVFACIFALTHAALWEMLTMPREALWSEAYLTTMLWNVLVYALLVALANYHRVTAWRHEREIASARLEAELREATLDAATITFHPERTLATLERLAESVHVDVAGTERAINRLADEMRAALDSSLAQRDDGRQTSDEPHLYVGS